jgi:hypothetical protein
MKLYCLTFMLILLSSSIYAEELPPKEYHVFTAKVSDVRLQGTLVEQGKSLDDTVSVKILAILFKKPIKIADVRKAQTYNIPELDTLISYLKDNISGSAKDMAAYWAPDEQKEMLADMSNPEMFNRNRKYRQNYPGLTVLGMVFQDRTITVLTKETDRNSVFPALGVTFIRIEGRLYLTNRPTNDLEIAIIEASFK